jgi:hypothetical protein
VHRRPARTRLREPVESCIRLLAFTALFFPFVVIGIRNSGKVTRGLLITTLLDELDNLIREFWRHAEVHKRMPQAGLAEATRSEVRQSV